ncbi:MAG TPA: sulfotransferase [Sphingomonas sp.]|jgi:hypothetical protein|nr:sulfotransferase [Sphingomonas sp.]
MPADRLPAFVVIGAVKGATTWIAHQLRQHPDLWLPDAEPHYFSSRFDRGIDWYRSLFDPAPSARILGEKSADYLAHPKAPARIAAALPEVRLVAQLRDPVERAYSDYCMLFRRGEVGGDLRSYLQNRDEVGLRFLEGGCYARHLTRWFEHFPRGAVQVLLYDDVCAEPEAVIERVCAHIGVEPHLAPAEVVSRRNDSRAEPLPLVLRRALKPVRPLLDPLRGVRWLERARGALARPIAYPPLTDELRAMLEDYYREDIDRLEDLIDRDLSAWGTRRAVREYERA